MNSTLLRIKEVMFDYILKMATARTEDTVTLRYPHTYGPDFDMVQYQQVYRVHPWVYTNVKIISQNISQLPLYFYREVKRGGEVENERVTDHATVAMMRRPNSYMGSVELIENTVAYLELNGNSYWWLLKNASGKVVSIIPLRPDRVVIVPTELGGIMGYMYRVGDKTYRLMPEEIIHFKYFNPYDDYYGQPPLHAAQNTINQDLYARRFNTSHYKNSAIPKGGLKFDRKLKDEHFKRIRAQWRESHGGPDKQGEIAIFDNGMDWVSIGQTHEEMSFIESLKMNRNEFGSVFGIPPVMYNDVERATYNNAWQQVAFFWHETAIPKTVKIASTINRNMNKLTGDRFQIPASKNTITAEFDISAAWALKRESQVQVKTDDIQIKNGSRTVNELRDRDGLDPVDWGDDKFSAGPGFADEATPDKEKLIVSPSSTDIAVVKDRRRDRVVEEWRRFVMRGATYESPFRSFVSKYLSAQEKMLLQNFWRFVRAKQVHGEQKLPLQSAVDVDLISFSMEKAIDEAIELSTPIYKRVMEAGGRRAVRLIGVGGSFDVNNPRAKRIMQDKQQKFAKKINNSTWEKVKASLVRGISEGESNVQLANRIEKTMKSRRASKYTIARTEVIGSLNGGMDEGFNQNDDIVEGKEWATAEDEHVREMHAFMDGEVVGVKQSFSNGLQYPGDPNGAPEEVINCRCTELPKLRD